MGTVSELIRKEADGTISFGDYSLESKSKLEDFEHNGDLYKVKTFKEITKLEKNGAFAYESVPGTTVTDFEEREDGVSFTVEGAEDAQITVEMEAETEYKKSAAYGPYGFHRSFSFQILLLCRGRSRKTLFKTLTLLLAG